MSFASQVKKGADQYIVDAMKVVSNVYSQASYKVVGRTPVDTGRLENNWNASFGSASPVSRESAGSERGSSGKDSFESIDRVTKLINETKLGESIFLTNGLAYAQDIEMGKSGQAPAGMMRLSVKEAGGTYK